MSEAFACIRNGKPLIPTVSPTELGAKVNALMFCWQVMIQQGTPTDVVDKIFTNVSMSKGGGEYIAPVRVSIDSH